MTSPKYYFDLSHFGLIQIYGKDAESFLQNQITADVKELQNKDWLVAAWCNPKGRILVNFILFQTGTDDEALFTMILPSMLKEKIIKRLKMFVLRSDVNIKDVSEEFSPLGFYGVGTESIFEQTTYLKKIDFKEETARSILIIHNENLGSLMNRIKLACIESDRRHWSLLDIQGAIPWVIPQTSEMFIPQMLNMDQTGGISFSKGCYPGQEVVARLHYRGEVKRRLHWVEGDSETLPGPGDILEKSDGKLMGEIVDAEPTQEKNRFQALAVIQENDGTDIRLRDQADTHLKLLPVNH